MEFIMFSAGCHICPGMNLANVEECVMLALCVQMFCWELGDPVNRQRIELGFAYIIRPKNTVLTLHALE